MICSLMSVVKGVKHRMGWKGHTDKRLWPISRFHLRVCMQVPTRIAETLKVVAVSAEVRTGRLPTVIQKRHLRSHLAQQAEVWVVTKCSGQSSEYVHHSYTQPPTVLPFGLS
jgi:hypothetical protein